MVAHPLMAAGWWFPGFGWVGLGLTALLLGVAFSRAAALLAGVLSVTSLLLGNSDPAHAGDLEFAGLATRSEPALGELDFAGHYRVATEAIAAARVSRARVVVLPEGSGGAWTVPMARLWEAYAAELAREGRTLVVGASTRGSSGALDNSAVVLGADGNVVVPQRLPIPVAMWRPWAPQTGFRAHPWAAGTVTVGGRVAGVIVCWEGALVLPVLLSIGAGAEVLIHLANHAWVGAAGLPTVVATRAFGALFNVPVVIARNAQGGDDA
jgi:predicted amidohydrolase